MLKELVETRKERSHLNNQLVKESEFLNAEIVDRNKVPNILVYKERINWRIVGKLELDDEMYMTELDDAKDLIQQLRMERLSVKQKLIDNELEMTEKIKISNDAL